ncbi:MAG: citryl-CoA lyase [Solirubrobacteraceae bacterium]
MSSPSNTSYSPAELAEQAHDWWTTEIIDIHPGEISIRGYAIEDLIGNVTFPEMIWLALRGELPSSGEAGLLEAALTAAIDHGPQAPSIAVARMAVTCGSPLNGAMASAINVLDDVHGGAGQQCMMLYQEIHHDMSAAGNNMDDDAQLAIVTSDVLNRWRVSDIKYIPGFGHRFHPVDPRAGRLLELVDRAVDAGVVAGEFAMIGRSVSQHLRNSQGTPIPMNIDGVTAVIYCELGFSPELGRGIFILSRSVGILAHAWEQMNQGGRIKGPMPPSLTYRYAGKPSRPLPDRADAGSLPMRRVAHNHRR